MVQPRLKRQSAGSVAIDTNDRCLRVYPTEDTKRTVSDLQTVGLRLSKEQAIHLARVLLVVTQEWDVVDVTAYRFEKRQEDGTYRLTITSQVEARAEEDHLPEPADALSCSLAQEPSATSPQHEGR